MSKRIEADMTCGKCKRRYPISIYRTIWIEYPENRELVFNDTLNVFPCPGCGCENVADLAVMATNRDRNFAVWYEPEPDRQIDIDREGYIKLFGEGNYFAEAPREKTWEAFKTTILDFEEGRRAGKPPEMNDPSMLSELVSASKPGCLGRLFGRR